MCLKCSVVRVLSPETDGAMAMSPELTFVGVIFFGLLEATHAMDLNYGQMPVEVKNKSINE